MQVVDRRRAATVLAGDEVVHHAGLQRTRTEQRDQRHDVVEAVRLELAHEVGDAARLELEDRRRPARPQQLERLGVVERNPLEVEGHLACRQPLRVDEAHGPVDDRERSQPKEVEFHEPDLLDVVLVELRHDARAAGLAVERREIRQRRGAMTTPPAWVPALRASPSSRFARSTRSRTSSSAP